MRLFSLFGKKAAVKDEAIANDVAVAETPRHLRIETYYLKEISHVKDRLVGMIELAMPDYLEERLKNAEDYMKLTRSFEGQFQILFGSLDLIRPQIGDENYEKLVSMANEARSSLIAGDYKAGAFKFQEMEKMAWKKKPKSKAQSIA